MQTCISLKALWQSKDNIEELSDESAMAELDHGGFLELGDDNGPFYQIRGHSGNLLCLDGEEIDIVQVGRDNYRCINRLGEVDTRFHISQNEYDHAIFGQGAVNTM